MKDKGLEKILEQGWRIHTRTREMLYLRKDCVEVIYHRKDQKIIEVYRLGR